MSKRVTDLPVATEVADNDPLLTTDVSTGLSKQAPRSLVGGNVGDSLRSVFFSDFELGDVAAISTSESTGTGTAGPIVASDPDADEGFGIWELATGAGAGAAQISHDTPPAFAFRGSLTRAIEVRVKLPSIPSDVTLIVGLHDFALGNAIFFGFNEGAGTWELFCASAAGGGNASDSTAIAAVGGWRTLRVEIDPGAEVRAYVDGVLVATVTSATAVFQGDDAFTAGIGCERAAGPSSSVFIDWVRVLGDRA